jgi:RimJ/RimL family protein N-acetyltransferase
MSSPPLLTPWKNKIESKKQKLWSGNWRRREVIELTREISPKQREWRNDPAISNWTRQNGLLSESDMTKWRARIENAPTILMFGILCDGVESGTCGLTSVSLMHGTAEFSLLVDPKLHGRGIGKAALTELLKYGFMHLRLNCIWGETMEGNHALKLFLSLGMKEEGRARRRYFKNGEYKDSIFISILREEAERQPWF